VLAGVQGGNGHGHMQVVMQAHVHRVDVIAGQERSEIGVGVRDPGPACDVGKLLGVLVGQGNHIGAGDFCVGG
jgi:hypothetical protein